MSSPSATIGALKVALGLDSAQFESGLKRSQGALASLGKLASIGLAAAGAAAAAAGAAAAVGIKKSIDAADEMLIASQKIGVGVEALSALKYAAELSAVSFEGLQNGLKKLSVNMAAAAGDANGSAATAFRTLGVAVTDASGQLRGSDQVFADVAEKFAGMQDGAGKTALAVQLFGKSGADLIPLLNEGKGGLAEMTAEAEALGLIISTKTAQAAESFNDNLDRLKKVGSGVSNQLAAQLAPALNDVTSGLVQAVKGSGVMDGIGKALAATLKVLATGAVVVGQAVSNMGRGFATVAQVIRQVFAGDFAGAMETYRAAVVENLKGIANSANAIKTIWTGAGAQNKAVAAEASDGMAAPIVGAANKAKAARKEIESESDKAAKALREFIAAEEKAQADRGFTPEQLKARELEDKFNEALAAGRNFEAAQLLRLRDAYMDLAPAVEKATVANADFNEGLTEIGQITESGPLDRFERWLDQVTGGFYQIGNAVDDVLRGIKGNDWVGAFGGLTRALRQVKDAFSASGTAAGKFAAVAGLANAVGGAIGGKVGGALSGAASGAAAGAAFGAPGAIVGGIIGGISGLFGASKAKKRAKKEAAARAKAEAEQKAADLAAAKRELELRLMELQGKGLEALAERRKDELASMDETLRALQEQAWALEDAAAAAEKAAALTEQRTALERELLGLQDAEAALAADRAAALAALDPSLRSVQQAIYDVIDAQAAQAEAAEHWADLQAAADDKVAEARQAVADAAEAEADRLGDVVDRFADLADGIADLRRELDKGGLGSMGPKAQLAAARAAFDAVAGRTDEASLAALPQAARDLIDAETAVATSRTGLNAVFAKVRQALQTGEAAARAQMTDAQKQLAVLHTQTDHLAGIQAGVLSVADAIAGVSNALHAQQSVFANALQAMDAIAGKVAAFDVAAAEKALNAMPSVPAVAAGDNQAQFATDVAGALVDNPGFRQLIVNTGLTARTLEDITYGIVAINTQPV